MELAYSAKPKGPKSVKAHGRDLDMSFKDAVVIADYIRGKNLKKASALLEKVAKLEAPVPYRKFKKGIGHRRGDYKIKTSKYPKKVVGEFIKLLSNLESNAEYKGLDAEKLKITHVQAQKGVGRTRRKPKGRWKRWERQFVSIQAIAEEK
jgi:large subunit ribosomal protein L22